MEIIHLLVAHRDAHRHVARTRDEAFAHARGLLERARAGEPLTDLAAVHSDEPYGAHRDGRVALPLGLAFEPLAAAEDLPVGGIAELAESEYGFHIVQRVR